MKIKTEDEGFEIMEQVDNKTFTGTIECGNCEKGFDPYNNKYHLMTGMMFVRPGEEPKQDDAHFLCEKCHKEIFGEGI